MTGPLAGLRVLEFAGIGPGPFACLMLAELGAEVIRIDRPSAVGSPARSVLGRSRPNLAVDLKSPQGRDVVLRLIADADVVVEGNRPGVMERLGLGPQECRAANPGLVYGRMTGWGQVGPLAQRAGHDITYAALTGALHATGGVEKPRNALNLVADFGGGAMFLVSGILAALFERNRSGQGQVVDAAMVDGVSTLMTMVYGNHSVGRWEDRREANLLDGGTPYYDTYACAGGGFVAVGAIEPQFFAELMKGTGLDFEQQDRASWPAMRAALAETFLTRTRDEWAAVFEGVDACVAPVLSLAEAPRHPHLAARGIFEAYADGHLPLVAPRFSRTPGQAPGEIRPVGEDSRVVLGASGFSGDEIDTLIATGVVGVVGQTQSVGL
ncbi:CoA transferase [Nocardioides immobilis]|uniref:CoA transferase n=1 Tax=Nocardioides immobilis TaxID=2049295 RepID=A0A417Y7V1_9ACTN|nr:CaiB/BaiF CoA-transferase family protein [Nocardioides immobilis]RHW28546.1 CoA transferase [Nocardioides immobilis]